MWEKIITTIITFVISGLLGYCVAYVKQLKAKVEAKNKNEKAQTEAIKTLLQNSLTNIYYVYSEIGEIPDYAYKNWLNLFNAYKNLGGNDFVDELNEKMKEMKVKITGVGVKFDI